ncbi:ester cyclase [Pseudoalteromonas aurantia]|uniref:Polyketide cyclase n=1 Tax=Pseudoalteromonas aurantia TaxID=43654 RepID=A0A5S3UXS7_9GAMM|nr:ester cyclase [Pseudoalteromonas aurantia]TMO62490.1 polyketide cyclase [Pseudoalteromonas aurantia]TMO62517.1 polyketide cyclase [Pseudoalteromonas aurantia]TMO76407.1 polyketide cyclase [Pseudoalteromonas aurantia]
MSSYQAEKSLIINYFKAMEQASKKGVKNIQKEFLADEYQFYGVYPFNHLSCKNEVADKVWQPLLESFSNLQRREDIFMAGENEISGENWVMSMGHFMGLFDCDWLGIKANRKLVMLRYAEFNCVENGKITKTGLWLDIIGLMQQAGCNPLPPQTGSASVYFGPRHHDGLLFEEHDPNEAKITLKVLNTMIEDLSILNQTCNDRAGPEVMQKNWHDDMVWYGPAGIGATYTIARYQEQHMYPFREGLHDKVFNGHVCRFAEGKFACFFGWPNLTNKSKGGFLGLPSGDTRADMRIVDVYYRSGDKLLENWVFMDIPYWLKQQGVDILARTACILNPTVN